MTLQRLLIRAGILSTWDQRVWFGDCTLQGNVLLVPNAELAASLRRCYLPLLQTVLADCEIRVGTKPQAVKAAYRGTSTEPSRQRLLD